LGQEAGRVSTADLAMIGEAARQAGARITATGDTGLSARSKPGECSTCSPAKCPPPSCMTAILPVASINAALVAPSRDASCGYVCPSRTASQS
jgi:hypothetical protein